MKFIHDFYHSSGFLHLDPNIITCNECEGGAGVFQVVDHPELGTLSVNDSLRLLNSISSKDSPEEWQKKYNIVVVPTIIVFNGEEVERFQADLSFKLLATRKEIQETIDEIIMSDF